MNQYAFILVNHWLLNNRLLVVCLKSFSFIESFSDFRVAQLALRFMEGTQLLHILYMSRYIVIEFNILPENIGNFDFFFFV